MSAPHIHSNDNNDLILLASNDIKKYLDKLAIPAVANVAGVFFLLVYIFAIVGMHMFGRMPADGDFFDEHANFKNVGIGMLTLFRCATGESWNGIMYDLMDRSPDKLAGFGVMVYFTIFTILGAMMMLNLIVAVVLEQFGTVTTKNRMPVTPVNIQQFNQAWTDVARELYTTRVCEDLLILKEKTKKEVAAAKKELNDASSENRPKGRGRRASWLISFQEDEAEKEIDEDEDEDISKRSSRCSSSRVLLCQVNNVCHHTTCHCSLGVLVLALPVRRLCLFFNVSDTKTLCAKAVGLVSTMIN